jgi:hypothetical protein
MNGDPWKCLQRLSHGHTPTAGAFRSHVKRLTDFLRKASTALGPPQAEMVRLAIQKAEQGTPLAGAWLEKAGTSDQSWEEIGLAVGAGQAR